jgi:response regulator RpfG family c-di-GMP phosphodiesterase
MTPGKSFMFSTNMTAPEQDRPLVLITDDDPFIRLQLKQLLKQENYQ